jgi:hypothetical protein
MRGSELRGYILKSSMDYKQYLPHSILQFNSFLKCHFIINFLRLPYDTKETGKHEEPLFITGESFCFVFCFFMSEQNEKNIIIIISNLFSDLRRLNSTSYIRLLFCLVPLITIYLSHSRPLTHFSQFFFFHLCLPLPFLLISYIFFFFIPFPPMSPTFILFFISLSQFPLYIYFFISYYLIFSTNLRIF